MNKEISTNKLRVIKDIEEEILTITVNDRFYRLVVNIQDYWVDKQVVHVLFRERLYVPIE